jgi:hypothetical protein
MLIVASIIAVLIFIILFMHFRYANLQRDLLLLDKENTQSKKESKRLVEALVLIAGKYEEFAKYRLKYCQYLSEKDEALKHNLIGLTIISPMINNYAHIFRECLKGNKKLSTIVESSYKHAGIASFQELDMFIKRQDSGLKNMWAQNDLAGFVSLIEALLIQQNKLFDADAKEQENSDID